MNNINHTILKLNTGQTSYNLPVFLENTLDDMGVMVPFDGEIEQIEQKCNFTYIGNANNVFVYNTVNTNSLTALVDSVFTIYWGDGSSDTLNMRTLNSTVLPNIAHEYLTDGEFTITVTMESPWSVKEVKKTIMIPFVDPSTYPVDLGVLVFHVPYTDIITTQEYLMDHTTTTGVSINLTGTTFDCISVGSSRIDELKKYGNSNEYSGITTGETIEHEIYSAYTIDGLYYVDFNDGMTYITGTRPPTGYTEEYHGRITRNELLIGFIEAPTVYSDIYIDRGKIGVLEKNLRLAEIDNVGELEIYGNGYFNIIKT